MKTILTAVTAILAGFVWAAGAGAATFTANYGTITEGTPSSSSIVVDSQGGRSSPASG